MKVILVDKNDQVLGTEDKLIAHREDKLHRAFSIFIFNSQGQMLLQQRAEHKYHSGGLWTNACCSHPRPGESTLEAAHRRLDEEMGFDVKLDKMFEFIYRAELDNGLIEHEYDHVFKGVFDGEPAPSATEVASWKWIGIAKLKENVRANPERYTFWFKHILDRVLNLEQA